MTETGERIKEIGERTEKDIQLERKRAEWFLKVCFVVRALPGHRLGGLEHHLRDLALALERRGHLIHIVTTPGGRKGFFPCPNYITEAGGMGWGKDEPEPESYDHGDEQDDTGDGQTLGGAAEPFEGEHIMIHEVPGVAPGNYSIGFFRRVDEVLQRVCRQHEIDVVVPIDMAGLFLQKSKLGVPVIPLIHGTMTSEVPLDWRHWKHLSAGAKLRALWTYKSRLVLWPFFRRMVNRADGIIVDSEFTRRELLTSVQGRVKSQAGEMRQAERLAALAQRIQVAQLGVDSWWYAVLSGPRYPEKTGPLRIGLLGRLQKMKGVEMAIRAAAGLRARGVDFVMTVGGRGSYEEEGRALVRELGLEKQVRFVGRVSPVIQMARFMEAQDVFLFPDLTQPAFGLVAVEAFYYGLPVVAARVGAVPEVVTDEVGWLYDAWDLNGLVEVLAEVAGDRGQVREKGWRAREVYEERFTAEGMAERTEAALRGIMNQEL